MPLKGTLTLPGDKSISHRTVMLAALSDQRSKVNNLSNGKDVKSTISCLKNCGIDIEYSTGSYFVNGGRFKQPITDLDCGNSGTTMRLLIGLLAGQGLNANFIGDKSLSNRPMERIIDPLKKMGLNIKSNKTMPPIHISKSKLKGIDYVMPIASAQLKSSILLAALGAKSNTTIKENIVSRDHTEIMLKNIGVNLYRKSGSIFVEPCKKFLPQNISVPADPSTAAFFIGAAVLIPRSKLLITNLLLNETRIGFLRALEKMGCSFNYRNIRNESGEKIGDLEVRYHKLFGIEINKSDIPSIIDEIPILALIASQAEGTTIVSGAEELRVKESDRLEAICRNLKAIGINVIEKPDGFIIKGGSKIQSGDVQTFDDHRIAMTFHIASVISGKEIKLDNAECVNISFPAFFKTIENIIR